MTVVTMTKQMMMMMMMSMTMRVVEQGHTLDYLFACSTTDSAPVDASNICQNIIIIQYIHAGTRYIHDARIIMQ